MILDEILFNKGRFIDGTAYVWEGEAEYSSGVKEVRLRDGYFFEVALDNGVVIGAHQEHGQFRLLQNGFAMIMPYVGRAEIVI